MYALVAADLDNGISVGNKIPWNLKEDRQFYNHVSLEFKKPPLETGKGVLLMGRTTWETIPNKPLPNRFNIVLSQKNPNEIVGGEKVDCLCRSIDEAVGCVERIPERGPIFVFGGSRVYREAFSRDDFDLLFLTRVHGRFGCDNFVDIDWNRFELVQNKIPNCTELMRNWLGDEITIRTDPKTGVRYSFECYKKIK